MSRAECMKRYRARHPARVRAQWKSWRLRHGEYMRLYNRIAYRRRKGQEIPADDLARLEHLRSQLSATSTAEESRHKVEIWEESHLRPPEREGETLDRSYLEKGQRVRQVWIAVRCRKCKELAWTTERNGRYCFDCVTHRCASELRRWIDAEIKRRKGAVK